MKNSFIKTCHFEREAEKSDYKFEIPRRLRLCRNDETLKKGFTLVELSIVLVIIGLLIGGILVAQSLVDSAKVNQVVRELQQYEIGITQFKERFRHLPGDHPQGEIFNSLCTNATCEGNGDGKIYRNTGFYLEMRNVWYHMQGAGFLNLNLPFNTTAGSAPSTWIPGDNFPQSSYGEVIGILFGTVAHGGTGTGVNTTPSEYTGKLALHLGSGSEVGVNLGTKGAFKPSVALALDNKLDDGIPNAGIFSASYTLSNRNCIVSPSNPLRYDLSYEDDVDGCIIVLVLENLN